MVNFQALLLEIYYEALSVWGVISLKLVCSYSFCRYSGWEVGFVVLKVLRMSEVGLETRGSAGKSALF